MIASRLRQLDESVAPSAAPPKLSLHLAGFAAIMESHFQYEERQLLGIFRRSISSPNRTSCWAGCECGGDIDGGRPHARR